MRTDTPLSPRGGKTCIERHIPALFQNSDDTARYNSGVLVPLENLVDHNMDSLCEFSRQFTDAFRNIILVLWFDQNHIAVQFKAYFFIGYLNPASIRLSMRDWKAEPSYFTERVQLYARLCIIITSFGNHFLLSIDRASLI